MKIHTTALSLVFPLSLSAWAGPTTNMGSSLLEYSSTQGTNGWNYGYYNRTTDPGGVYSGTEFVLMPTDGGGGYAVGGNPPWTSISSNLGGHPNLDGTNGEHWIIRRYTVGAGEGGAVDLNWLVSKGNVGCGDGVTGMVYHNGSLVDSASVAFDNGTGVYRKAAIPMVSPGDTIDMIVSPGTGTDWCDGSNFRMEMNRVNVYSGLTTTLIADSRSDFGQNTNGWTYGIYDITANGSPGPGEFQPFDGSAWTGSSWDLPGGGAPWTGIDANGGHPNGTNNGVEHWATRQYTIGAGEEGLILLEWDLSKANASGGGGTSVHILHNGTEVASTGVEGWDNLGFMGRLLIPGVAVGDTLAIALAPQGLDVELFGTGDIGDGNDGSIFGMKIYSVPEPGVQSVLLFVLGTLVLRRQRR
ncbi:MAG: hypothetical protein KA004_08610 [Verrucomicrobiales bacterium]|nr:hypothetical protein [Verrucomicrobiales bacterium]